MGNIISPFVQINAIFNVLKIFILLEHTLCIAFTDVIRERIKIKPHMSWIKGLHRDPFEASQCCINNPHVSDILLQILHPVLSLR